MRDTHPHQPATRRRRLAGRLALFVLLALALAACGEAPQTVLDPQGPYAEDPDTLFRFVIIIALVVFTVVQGLIVFAVWRYRDRGDDTLPEQVHGNTKMELVWTIIPALILAGIAVPTIQQVFELDQYSEDALTIEVIGHRWWWEYRYPDNGGFVTANEMVVPTGRDVHLVMTAEEAGGPDNAVIHSYWVPAVAGKQDVVPGRITTLNFHAETEGVFQGQCTEYCGLSHANMRNYLTVVSPEEFDAWVEHQLSAPAEPTDPNAIEGKRLFAEPRDVVGAEGSQFACISCHAIGDEGGIVGPNLTHLMDREMFAGAIFDLYERPEGSIWGDWTDTPDREALIEWVMNAPEQKAMRPIAETGAVGMPNLGLSREEAEAIVDYLLTLR